MAAVCAKRTVPTAPLLSKTAKLLLITANALAADAVCGACPTDAVSPDYDEANDILNCKIAEYSLAVFKRSSKLPYQPGRWFLTFLRTATAILKMTCLSFQTLVCLQSSDPVALDMACVDAVNRQPVMAGSILAEQNHCHHDHFTDTHPETNWESCIDHAVKLGLGSKEYHLIENLNRIGRPVLQNCREGGQFSIKPLFQNPKRLFKRNLVQIQNLNLQIRPHPGIVGGFFLF